MASVPTKTFSFRDHLRELYMISLKDLFLRPAVQYLSSLGMGEGGGVGSANVKGLGFRV